MVHRARTRRVSIQQRGKRVAIEFAVTQDGEGSGDFP
jgi:hypothetical protein